MIAYYMDENVDGRITRGLRRRGIDVLTVQEDGRENAPDPEVLDRARETDRVLFSQDADLVAEAVNRLRNGFQFTGVVYVTQLGASIGRCIEDLAYLATAGDPEDFKDRIYYLPL